MDPWFFLFPLPMLLAAAIDSWLVTGGRRLALRLAFMRLPAARTVALPSVAATGEPRYRDPASTPGRVTLRPERLVDAQGATLLIEEVAVGEEPVVAGVIRGADVRFRRWLGTVAMNTNELVRVDAEPVPGGVRLVSRVPLPYPVTLCFGLPVGFGLLLGQFAAWGWLVAPAAVAVFLVPALRSLRRRLTPAAERAHEAIAVRIDASCGAQRPVAARVAADDDVQSVELRRQQREASSRVHAR